LLPCHRTTALQQQQEEQQQLEGAISMLDDKSRMAVELVFVQQAGRGFETPLPSLRHAALT